MGKYWKNVFGIKAVGYLVYFWSKANLMCLNLIGGIFFLDNIVTKLTGNFVIDSIILFESVENNMLTLSCIQNCLGNKWKLCEND